ncbi:alpha-1,2-fucosyltransferase [Flavobacterium ginsengiterrae]|uniref:Alpha-1,2-fucosyltransferase n=1 Tax=Flavobacterium ginsengiterrae TaxID=871695 RepID=A0ABP7H167_9FLAO
MLTFNSLGRKGNLGNQLFQISSTIGLAKKHNKEVTFPKWQYKDYFEGEFEVLDSNIKLIQIVEKSYEYHEWIIGNENYDINGALQSEKYFNIEETKKAFTFKTSFLKPIISKYNYLFSKPHVIISVRRGDFVHHPDYYQLPYQYYILALREYFPDWKDRNLIFMSDNIEYCKNHFGFLKNAFFLENLSAIEQLAIGSLGQDFIISNSTFSWWAAWLAEKQNSKIIRPLKNFRGSFAKENNDKDYFPDRWIKFDYKKKNLRIQDTTLILKGEVGKFYDLLQYGKAYLNLNFKKALKKVFK